MAAIFKMAADKNLKIWTNFQRIPVTFCFGFYVHWLSERGFSIQPGYVRGYIVTCLQSQP